MKIKIEASPSTLSDEQDDYLTKSLNKFFEDYEYWKSLFLEKYNSQNFEVQLDILSHYESFPGFPDRPQFPEFPDIDENEFKPDEILFFYDYTDWRNTLLIELVQNSHFPDPLLPAWSVEALKRRLNYDLLPNIESGIEYLLLAFKTEILSEAKILEHKTQLSKILKWLRNKDLNKFLRYSLLLMRFSPHPLADKDLKHIELKDDTGWYKPLISHCLQSIDELDLGDPDYYSERYISIYKEFSKMLVDFCISRLSPEKKLNNPLSGNNYSQAIEKSAIWRHGYLKAIRELEPELTEELDRTLNFIKCFDPDAELRALAESTYKFVRHPSSRQKNSRDLHMETISAERWLFLSQRNELNLPIEYKEEVDIPF